MICAERRNALLCPRRRYRTGRKRGVDIYSRSAEQLRRLAPEQESAHVRGYDGRAAEAREYLFEHLRSAVNGVGNSDVDSGVKYRYHAERAYLFIYREHSLIVREEALVVGVQLDSLYARVMQSVELAQRVRALEMDAAERDENIVAEQRDGEVVDLRLLMRVCRNIEHRRPVGAAGKDALSEPRRCAVERRTRVARARGEHRHSLFRERVGEAVGVHIYNHS